MMEFKGRILILFLKIYLQEDLTRGWGIKITFPLGIILCFIWNKSLNNGEKNIKRTHTLLLVLTSQDGFLIVSFVFKIP